MRVLDNKILVQMQDTTAGGIALPPSLHTLQVRGTVVAVGPGKWLESGIRSVPDVQPGDEIVYQSGAGTEIIEGGVTYRLIEPTAVLFIP